MGNRLPVYSGIRPTCAHCGHAGTTSMRYEAKAWAASDSSIIVGSLGDGVLTRVCRCCGYEWRELAPVCSTTHVASVDTAGVYLRKRRPLCVHGSTVDDLVDWMEADAVQGLLEQVADRSERLPCQECSGVVS